MFTAIVAIALTIVPEHAAAEPLGAKNSRQGVSADFGDSHPASRDSRRETHWGFRHRDEKGTVGDTNGIDCAVTLDSTTHRLSGTCDGEDIQDVISAGDILYIELFLSGNAENVLYRFNFEGLKPRTDFVSASTEFIEDATLAYEGKTDPRTEGRPISERALAECTVSPIDMRHGLLRICTDVDCSDAQHLIREAQLDYLNGHYTDTTILTTGQTEAVFINRGPTGIEGAERFTIPLPNWLGEVGRIKPTSPTAPQGIWCRLEPLEPGKAPVSKALGLPKGHHEGLHSFAAEQMTADGLNVADGHLAFTHVDFAVPLMSTQLSFARTYNNQNNEVTPLGTGWHHNWDVELIEEKPGSYEMRLAGQGYTFPSCPAPDDTTQASAQCLNGSTTFKNSDGAHGMELSFVYDNSKLVFTVQDLGGTVYRFARRVVSTQDDPEKKLKRRWLLTEIGTGHEGTNAPRGPNDACGLEWLCLDYEAGTNLPKRVFRNPGNVELKFDYVELPTQAASRVTKASKQRFVKRLERVHFVDVRTSAMPADIQSIAFEADFASGSFNLKSAALERGAPLQKWSYEYLPPGAGALNGVERWALTNELKAARRLEAVPMPAGFEVMMRAEWEKRLSDISPNAVVPGYVKLQPGEVVTQEVLPGQQGLPTVVEFKAASGERRLTRQTGLEYELKLDKHGRLTNATQGTQSWTNAYTSNAKEAARTVQSRQAPDGVKLGYTYETSNAYLVKQVAFEGAHAGTATSLAIPGLSLHDALSNVPANSRVQRFNVSTKVEQALAGSVTATSTLGWTDGELSGVTTGDGTESFAVFSGAQFTGLGKQLDKYTDALGREHAFSAFGATNPFGLPEKEVITFAAKMRTRHFVWDGFGRLLNATEDETGAEAQLEHDVVGRLTLRRVKAQPAAEEWSYARRALGPLKYEVTERCAGTGHEKKSVFEDGLKMAEEWKVGHVDSAGSVVNDTVDAGYAYDKGLLKSAVDSRGAAHHYSYNTNRHLERVEAQLGNTGPFLPEMEYSALDKLGQPELITDSLGHVTRITYDTLGRPAKWDFGLASADGTAHDIVEVNRGPSGAVLRAAYGAGGGHVLTFQVDALGRRRAVTATDGQVSETSHYDAAGRLVSRSDSVTGLSESWEYVDVAGRLTKYTRTLKSGLKLEETHAYDDSTSERKESITRVIGGRSSSESQVRYFDEAGRLLRVTQIISGNAAEVAFERNGRGQVVAATKNSTSPLRAVTRIFYDAAGRRVGVKDERGRLTRYTFDGEGNLTEVHGPHPDRLDSFIYDAAGELLAHQQAREGSSTPTQRDFSRTHDSANVELAGLLEQTQVEGASGLYTATVRTLTNARGRVLKRELGVSGMAKVTDELGYDGEWTSLERRTEGSWKAKSTRTFDARGRPKLVREEWESGTGRSYDFKDDLTWSAISSGTHAKHDLTWKVNSNPITAPSPPEEDFDSLGGRTKLTLGDYSDSWALDADGALAVETLSGSLPRALEYDVSGFPRRQTWGSEVTDYAFDINGRLARMTEPQVGSAPRRVRSLQYELLATGGENVVEAYGDVSASGVANHATVTLTQLDAFDALVRVTKSGVLNGASGGAATWSYQLGPRGLLTRTTLPTGAAFSYGYDALGGLSSLTPPAGSAMVSESYAYDFLGRPERRARGGSVWSSTWSNGAQVELAPPATGDGRTVLYDGEGRVVEESFMVGPASVGTQLTKKSMAHDGFGALISLRETRSPADVDMSWQYNSSHLLALVTRAGSPNVAYTYDTVPGSSRNPKSMTVAGAGAVDYAYDAFDRLSSVTTPELGVTSISIEPGGERLSLVSGGGVSQRYCHDARGELTQLVALPPALASTFQCGSAPPLTAIVALEYGYDERGNRVGETRTSGGSVTTRRFGVDLADRLTGEQLAGAAATTWELHPDGARHRETRYSSFSGSLSPPFGTGAAASTAPTSEYFFDGQGALSEIKDAMSGSGIASYVVDASGRVHQEQRGGVTRDFTWDVDERLIRAVVTSAAGVTEVQSTYDGLGMRRSAVTTRTPLPPASPTVAFRSWAWSGAELVAEAPEGQLPQLRASAGDIGLGQGRQRWATDALGSVAARVDAQTGGVLSEDAYDAWGVASSAPSASQPSQAFAGMLHDEAIGKSAAGERWYDALTGQFLSVDPLPGRLEEPRGLRPHAYANGSPTNLVDPMGTQAMSRFILTPSIGLSYFDFFDDWRHEPAQFFKEQHADFQRGLERETQYIYENPGDPVTVHLIGAGFDEGVTFRVGGPGAAVATQSFAGVGVGFFFGLPMTVLEPEELVIGTYTSLSKFSQCSAAKLSTRSMELAGCLEAGSTMLMLEAGAAQGFGFRGPTLPSPRTMFGTTGELGASPAAWTGFGLAEVPGLSGRPSAPSAYDPASMLNVFMAGRLPGPGGAPPGAGPAVAPPPAPAPAPPRRINLVHIFLGEIGRGLHGHGPPRARGFHHRTGAAIQGRARVVPGTETPPGRGGTFQAQVEVFDPVTNAWIRKGQPGSTFFPDAWTRARVIQEIQSAFRQRIPLVGRAANQWRGVSPSGLTLEGYFDPLTGNIETAYPSWPQP